MPPVTYLIVGAGNRGETYARYALECPEQAQVVAVAEPRQFQREALASDHEIPPEQCYTDWREVAALPRLADAVVIATQDTDHKEPAVAFANLGYHILLEKPMSTCEDECRAIMAAVEENNVLFAVGHVLRYTSYFAQLKALLDEGVVGDIVTMQHCEPVGFWHMAHSFVRGNWRNSEKSTFMLLAKSCHDLDIVRWLMEEPCTRVSSFGSLTHFKPENKPADAGDRCIDCAVEADCPYSAKRLYHRFREKGSQGWPLSIITNDFSEAGVDGALREGPYGRCVYACDNDVVDHQVVNMEFASDRTANFIMTAFSNERADRTTRVFGTHGEIQGDGRMITIHRFLENASETIDTQYESTEGLAGHGGGDGGLISAFTAAIAANDPSLILSGSQESLESHLMVFAAETARRSGQVVEIDAG